MKLTTLVLVCAAVALGLFSSCTSIPGGGRDSVRIADVKEMKMPNSDLTSYKVRVAYSLATKEHGRVMLGFDTEKLGYYEMMTDEKVDRGTGEIELIAAIRPPMRSALTVYVNLSEDPHRGVWIPLANNKVQVKITK